MIPSAFVRNFGAVRASAASVARRTAVWLTSVERATEPSLRALFRRLGVARSVFSGSATSASERAQGGADGVREVALEVLPDERQGDGDDREREQDLGGQGHD